MRLSVVGAGAIGGIIAARLALAGETVTAVVRDAARRRAIAEEGFGVIETSGECRRARGLKAVASMREAGPQDVVIIAVKAHQIAALVPGIRALFAPETAVVTLQNGLPWWYFERAGGAYEGRRLAALDPDGAIAKAIEAERIIGGVAYIAAELAGPALVRHGGGNRLPLGELDGRASARAERLSAALARAGIEAPVTRDIRAELWFKLWGNACYNPLGALSHATVGEISRYPPTRALVGAMMEELRALAGKFGVVFRQSVAERMASAERIAAHRTSMLQDVEAGRALEVEALMGAVVELGRMTATPLPHFEAVHASVALLDAEIAESRLAFVREAIGRRA